MNRIYPTFLRIQDTLEIVTSLTQPEDREKNRISFRNNYNYFRYLSNLLSVYVILMLTARVSGRITNKQMQETATIVLRGMARDAW